MFPPTTRQLLVTAVAMKKPKTSYPVMPGHDPGVSVPLKIAPYCPATVALWIAVLTAVETAVAMAVRLVQPPPPHELPEPVPKSMVPVVYVAPSSVHVRVAALAPVK